MVTEESLEELKQF